MARASLLTTTSIPGDPGPKPRDEELDLFGLTHPGKVRRQNDDHFLVCTVHQQIAVHGTSLPEPDRLPLRSQRLATILLVADGVGGRREGGEASRLAAEAIMRYVSSTMQCVHLSGRSSEQEFHQALRAAALEAHEAVRAEAVQRKQEKGMATTLTLGIAVWPQMYVVQVGDSRCYLLSHGKLRQVTRDQTLAQNLADQGALPADRVASSPFSHVLASAIGGTEATPEVTRLNLHRNIVALFCTDGLTKHVSDAEIADQMRAMESSEQLCRTLLDLALERGGNDNITVLAGRARGTEG